VVAGRAAVAYGTEAEALRAAASVKSDLRRRLTATTLRLGPAWIARQRPGEITTLATAGLDSLDPYFARYLPQIVLAGIVPLAVLARITAADWISGLVIGLTLPLVPVFAVLVGLHTQARTQRQWALLARLGGHFLDVVEGLPTLKLFRQERRQGDIIARVTDEHRRATMATLRQAFLSALVLDLAATLATALVAVEVGIRLLGGHLGYQQAMMILLLTPEAYLPLRAVGMSYHASMEGAAAGGRAIEILDAVPEAEGSAEKTDPAVAPDLRRDAITLSAVSLGYPGRGQPALDELSLRIDPGDKILICGPSGAGKSSVLAVLLGFAQPTAGRIAVGGTELGDLEPGDWHRQVAWVPQHPALFAGSIRDNIALGWPEASDDAVLRAAGRAGAAEFIRELPAGLRTGLGERGLELSAGQRQRLALARAFLRDSPLLLLDEPTAHLDAASSARVRSAVRSALADRTVVVVSHDENWAGSGWRRVRLLDGRALPEVRPDRRAAPDGRRAPSPPEGLPAEASR
jgi:ATP-binding cassette, subfamily C, bacterial CydD